MLDLSQLNPSQKEVVLHSDGPLMVIAGPGTGKTFTLVKKVIYLLTEKNISPESIFITTFTRKAVNELRIRIAEEIKKLNLKIDSNRIKISTFHSFCIEILEREKYNILDDMEQRYFIYKNIGEFEKIDGFNLLIASLATNFQPKSMLLQKQFNKLSEHNISPNSLIQSTNRQIGILGLVYDRYLYLLKRENLLDFSTIQSVTLNLLERKNEIMESLHTQFKYILVDEYQDTNTIQNQILFKFFSQVKNLCVVGDEDQSIYRFRGATVRNILNFPHKFSHENFKTVKLEINFRSNKEIIDFYSKFMDRYDWENGRYKKNLLSASIDVPHPTVGKVVGATKEDWELSVIELIKTLKEKNIISDYSDIAFLAQSVKTPDILSLIKKLNENGIPTYSPRSGNFFHKEEIQVVIGIALSLFKTYTRELYKKVDYNNFETYKYYKEAISLLKSGEEGKFKDMIPFLKNEEFNSETKFLNILYRFFSSNYFKNIFAQENLEDKTFEIIENNLSILSNIIFHYEERYGSIFQEDFFDFYLPFLKECGINEYENEREVSIKNHISFLTFHQSKGLEFPVVLAGSLDKEPKKSSNDLDKILRDEVFKISPIQFEKEEVEDFYRIFYTGFSRAKNYLFLACKDNRELPGKGKKIVTPSKFFGELLDSTKDFKEIFSEDSVVENYLKVENSKDNFFKKRYSFTGDIALYLQCPVKYRFLRYSNFPKSQSSKEYLGILVHNTIHNIHQKVLEKEFVTEAVVKELLNSNYKQLKNKFNFSFDIEEKKIAYLSVVNYLSLESYSLMNIEKSEIELSILRDNYILHGVLDLLKKQGESYSIIDFKTSSKKHNFIPENYKKQLYIYGYLAEASGYPIKNLELYYTSVEKEPKFTFSYEKTKLSQVLKEADKVVEKIMKKEFFNSQISNSCNSCPFIHYCSNNTHI